MASHATTPLAGGNGIDAAHRIRHSVPRGKIILQILSIQLQQAEIGGDRRTGNAKEDCRIPLGIGLTGVLQIFEVEGSLEGIGVFSNPWQALYPPSTSELDVGGTPTSIASVSSNE